MIKHKHISLFQPGVFAMIGMLLMLLFFSNYYPVKNFYSIQIDIPSYKSFLTIEDKIAIYNKSKFYTVEFPNTTESIKLYKTNCNNLLQNEKFKNEYDGIKIKFSNKSTYADFIYFLNLALIKKCETFSANNEDVFYFYFKNKLQGDIEINASNYNPPCILIKQDNYKFDIIEILQLHITYWYFWLLYFITVFFSIKKLKNYHKSY